jgi:hypothetical protein
MPSVASFMFATDSGQAVVTALSVHVPVRPFSEPPLSLELGGRPGHH